MSPSQPARFRKVVVVGLDGLDPVLVRDLISAGQLPHMGQLAAEGIFSPLGTTLPAQTPTAWSTFATGLNPGGHGIYDFLRRDPSNYRLDFSLFRLEQRSRFLPVSAVNLRGGRTMWERLADVGIPSTVLRCPATFPPESFKGRLLAGVGVPDLSGGIGVGMVARRGGGGAESPGRTITLQGGPIDFRGVMEIRTPLGQAGAALELAVGASGEQATLSVGGSVAPLRQGEWTNWLQVDFKGRWLGSVPGLVRVFAARLGSDPIVYLGPVNLDPRSPVLPISHPWGYAAELERAIGAYGTLGMLEDHEGLSSGHFDEHAFLKQASDSMSEREAMFRHELGRLEHGLLVCVFDTPDRIQHMFWRYRESDHPALSKHDTDAALRDTIESAYRRCDAMVGEAIAAADAETLVMVVSDHGFGTFRRAVEVNRWLLDNGWLALRSGVDPSDPATDLLGAVDWDATRAYALGFGSIYLNVAGREANGIVQESERPELGARLSEQLSQLRDPVDGSSAVAGVSRAEEVWHGARTSEAPDLVVRFNRGFRAGWTSATGGVGDAVFVDNTRRWSGDHIFDPAQVPGILLMNRQVGAGRGPWLGDCAPTVLDALGAWSNGASPAGAGMEGRSLLEG